MRVWRYFSPLLAVVLVLNLISMVVAPSVAVADERPALTYFALGDSYASGHGLADDGGACRRSKLAYPYLVRDALLETYNISDFRHLACSGRVQLMLISPSTSRLSRSTTFFIIGTGQEAPILFLSPSRSVRMILGWVISIHWERLFESLGPLKAFSHGSMPRVRPSFPA